MDYNKKAAYARLLLTALNLQKGQLLCLSADVAAADFAHIVVEEAYRMGARDVDLSYSDSAISKLRINHAHEDALTEEVDWQELHTMHGIDQKACYLSIGSPNYLASQGVDLKRLSLAGKTTSKASERKREVIGNNELRWASACIPNPVWAKLIFPDLSEEAAVERLWAAILKTSYADCDNVEEVWSQHVQDILYRRKKLNELQLEKLHFKSANGTDIEVVLCEKSVFDGGCEYDPNGIAFTPNVPTEEIFTSPHRLKVNGVVKSTKPLMRSGGIIENFTLHFRDGKVIDMQAEKGEDILLDILDTDEGSRYIGEVALVPKSSPINQCGHLFYNTLFDENATCHLALGRGYSSAIDTDETDREKLQQMGLNSSKVHVDFMFGTDDLLCVGTTKDGREITILKDGEFVI